MGSSVLNQPLTVVLPLYNFERQLHTSVREVLDLAHSFTQDFSIVIVDDGSTDETYETACELARTYPQIQVLRHSVHQGWGSVLELVRNCTSAEMVVVHDGVSPIDVLQLKSVLKSGSTTSTEQAVESMRDATGQGTSASRRFASMRALHDNMERAHRSLRGFTWMKLEKPLVPRRCRDAGPPPVVGQLADLPMPSTPLPLR